MRAQLEIVVRNGTEPVEVSLFGDMDLATEGQVVEALSWLAAKAVIVDLSRVDFIDSSGIRALVIGHRAAEEAGGSLALRAPSSLAARVLDMTGITGIYDIDLEWMPDEGEPAPRFALGGGGPAGEGRAAQHGGDRPTIFAAVQEKLGLKLEGRKGPVEIIVVDHVDKVPTEN